MSEVLLRTANLSRNFGGVQAVSDVTFELRQGTLHAVIGPNGAGKTTFFHLLTGVYKPTSGSIFFKGEDISSLGTAERVKLGLARSYQRTNIFPRLSVKDNLLLAASRAHGEGWSVLPRAAGPQARQLVEETISLLKLDEAAGRQAQTLPYGAQRLVDIGIALCCRPTLLLLDEPTSGLSSAELREAVDTLRALRERFTILLIEHNMEFVVGMADRVSVLDFGRLIAEGTPEEVARDPQVQRAYFGSRRMSAAR